MKEMGDGRKMDYEEKMTGGRREERGIKTKNYIHGFITHALQGPNMVYLVYVILEGLHFCVQ